MLYRASRLAGSMYSVERRDRGDGVAGVCQRSCLVAVPEPTAGAPSSTQVFGRRGVGDMDIAQSVRGAGNE